NFAQDTPSPLNAAQQPLIPFTPKIYICPSDPSGITNLGMVNNQPCASYMSNGQLFARTQNPRVPGSMPDGVSTTAMFFEGYARCDGTNFALSDMVKIGVGNGSGSGMATCGTTY